MADIPETLFQQIYRRTPTDRDRERLVAVKSALGLSERDEMWPLFLALDHYSRTTDAARRETLTAIGKLPEIMSSSAEAAEVMAKRGAEAAIVRVVKDATDRIAKVVVSKSETRADRISKRKFTIAMIAGGVLAAGIAAVGAGATYFVLDAGGICAQTPVSGTDGRQVCYVDPPSG